MEKHIQILCTFRKKMKQKKKPKHISHAMRFETFAYNFSVDSIVSYRFDTSHACALNTEEIFFNVSLFFLVYVKNESRYVNHIKRIRIHCNLDARFRCIISLSHARLSHFESFVRTQLFTSFDKILWKRKENNYHSMWCTHLFAQQRSKVRTLCRQGRKKCKY